MGPQIPEDERDFVEQLKRGEQRAFRRLIDTFKRPVFNIAFHMLLDAEEANDVSQNVFLAVFRTIKNFRGACKLSTWIHTIAVNQTRNRLKALSRKKKAYHSPLEDIQEDQVSGKWQPAMGAPPDKQAEANELRRLIQATIHALDDEQREVLVLYDMNGLSYAEIVESTGLPAGTVKSRLHRARGALADAIAAWHNADTVDSSRSKHNNRGKECSPKTPEHDSMIT
jgi:RNA polymerase sigma-70 factor (ECF subfamily)